VHPIGVSASKAEDFFTQLELAAKRRGYTVARPRGVANVKTAEGDWLQYDLDAQKKEVLLTIVPNADNLSDTEIAARQEKLRALSDELVAEARLSM
jgi:hypothetical protein